MQTEFMSAIEQIMEGAKKLKEGLDMEAVAAINAAFSIWNDVQSRARERELAAEYASFREEEYSANWRTRHSAPRPWRGSKRA